jgi:fructan beta-fructosidase
MQVSGFIGKGFVNSYVGGDTTVGTLTSPAFTIQRKFINFLIGGGYHPGRTTINLLVNGKAVLMTTGKSKTPQDSEALSWSNWDVAKWQGKSARIEIVDAETGGWGHINVDEIWQSDAAKPVVEPLYRETYRPQFHFTAKKNWLNDPNGLVFADGEYHLFFQHNPGGIQWGDMHWGHAVSRDLFHWKELPIALSPDKLGTNFSGSADIDFANTTGFGKDSHPPMVAMYTAAGKPFTQCLAYSNDRGRTWMQYSGNPVLKHIKGENRDPRIFWHKPSLQWIMALYLDGDEFGIFGSPNLKEWKEFERMPGTL